MAQKNFTGWAEYRRRRKTPPAHAAGPSRVGLAPLPPRKFAGGDLFYLKRTFNIAARWRPIFWDEFWPKSELFLDHNIDANLYPPQGSLICQKRHSKIRAIKFHAYHAYIRLTFIIVICIFRTYQLYSQFIK